MAKQQIKLEKQLREQPTGDMQYEQGYFLTANQLSKLLNIHVDYLCIYLNAKLSNEVIAINDNEIIAIKDNDE